MKERKRNLETVCIQGGWTPGNGESRVLPIYQSTTFKYETSEQMGRLFDLEEDGYFYTRLANPTNDAVAAKICELEGGEAAILTSSGQAANAALGAPLLAKLNGQAAGRIDLMAGCGVKRTNIAGIAAQTGITTFHTTGRKGSVDSGMRYRKEGVSMGLPSLSEYELWLTDEAEFRACAETVHALGTPGAQA